MEAREAGGRLGLLGQWPLATVFILKYQTIIYTNLCIYSIFLWDQTVTLFCDEMSISGYRWLFGITERFHSQQNVNFQHRIPKLFWPSLWHMRPGEGWAGGRFYVVAGWDTVWVTLLRAKQSPVEKSAIPSIFHSLYSYTINIKGLLRLARLICLPVYYYYVLWLCIVLWCIFFF